jgi:2-polyprenyl-6-methoxyphenol hydroxylase-like FAD-dependent oxidoreductase
MSQEFDVCIRGDGVVGRSLALLLARQRLRVALCAFAPASTAEPPKAPDVRAYALNQASRTLLESLRVWPGEVTPVGAMQVWGDEGGRIDFRPPPGQQELAWLVEAEALQETLAQALRFAPEVHRVDPLGDVPAKLTVICEGRASCSRKQLGVNWQARPYAQTALAARLLSDEPHGGVARQWFCGPDIVALLPTGGAQGHELALVWSVPTPRAQELLALGAADFARSLHAALPADLAPLSLQSQVMAWPLQWAQADRWVGPGWALAGDAAHTVHPLAGQGLNLGLADAQTLAQVLTERAYWRDPGDLRLLRRYERQRKADVLAMGLLTDGLQGLFSHTDVRWQALRNWGMNAVGGNPLIKSWLMRQAMG